MAVQVLDVDVRGGFRQCVHADVYYWAVRTIANSPRREPDLVDPSRSQKAIDEEPETIGSLHSKAPDRGSATVFSV